MHNISTRVCSNASGTIKLSIHLIDKSKHPRCFSKLDMSMLQLKYTMEPEKLMDDSRAIITAWFHEDFVPSVRKQLIALKLKPIATIVLDNCYAHPAPEDLVSDDGAIFAKYLPPKCDCCDSANGPGRASYSI